VRLSWNVHLLLLRLSRRNERRESPLQADRQVDFFGIFQISRVAWDCEAFRIGMDAGRGLWHGPGMAKIGERTGLKILKETRHGVFLEAGELGEVLLPRRELPAQWQLGEVLEVFIYTDSEDRPVATMKPPLVLPGQFGRLRVVAATPVGAFLDWGLAKDLLVPFREQKSRMEVGKAYVVQVRVDEESGRIIGSTRLTRYLDLTPPPWKAGDEVELLVYGKTPLGYKTIIAGTHTGLLFANEVFQPLQPGERLTGYIVGLRDDGKIDLSLQPPGRSRVDSLEERILMEIKARGGYWALSDASPAEEIHQELGVSKRTFKQATGALFRKRRITLEPKGLRLA